MKLPCTLCSSEVEVSSLQDLILNEKHSNQSRKQCKVFCDYLNLSPSQFECPLNGGETQVCVFRSCPNCITTLTRLILLNEQVEFLQKSIHQIVANILAQIVSQNSAENSAIDHHQPRQDSRRILQKGDSKEKNIANKLSNVILTIRQIIRNRYSPSVIVKKLSGGGRTRKRKKEVRLSPENHADHVTFDYFDYGQIVDVTSEPVQQDFKCELDEGWPDDDDDYPLDMNSDYPSNSSKNKKADSKNDDDDPDFNQHVKEDDEDDDDDCYEPPSSKKRRYKTRTTKKEFGFSSRRSKDSGNRRYTRVVNGEGENEGKLVWGKRTFEPATSLDGVKGFKCSSCGTFKELQKSMLSHFYYHEILERSKKELVTPPRQLKRNGNRARTYVVKGEGENEGKLVWRKWTFEPATSDDGVEGFKCNTCGTFKELQKSMLDHFHYHEVLERSKKEFITPPRRLKRNGNRTRTKVVDGEGENAGKLVWKKWTFEPATSDDGIEGFKCNTCGTFKESQKSMVAHFHYHEVLERSKKEFVTPPRRGNSRKRPYTKVVDGEGENEGKFLWGKWIFEPTTSNDGVEGFKCTSCGAFKESQKAMLFHFRYHEVLERSKKRIIYPVQGPKSRKRPYTRIVYGEGENEGKFMYGKWIFEPMTGNDGIEGFKCTSCGAFKESKRSIQDHCRYHDILEGNKLTCKFCHKAFGNSGHLAEHEKVHTNLPPEPDEDHFFSPSPAPVVQGKSSKMSTAKSSHVLGHKWRINKLEDGTYSCETCGRNEVNRFRMSRHVKLVHMKQEPLVCPMDDCGKMVTESLHEFLRHCNTHPNLLDWTVIPCGGSRFLYGLKWFFESCSNEAPGQDGLQFKCSTCNVLQETEDQMVTHISEAHADPRKRGCYLCGKECKDRRDLSWHLRRHYKIDQRNNLSKHGVNVQYCEYNGKKWPFQWTGGDGGRYDCRTENCRAHGSTVAIIRSHIRIIHAYPKKFVCDVCGAAFGNGAYFKKHQLLHSEEPGQYVCDSCGMSFKLVQHLHQHQGKKHQFWKCDKCETRFAKNEGLEKHLKTCLGYKVKFKCPHCRLSYKWEQSLAKHVAKKHPSAANREEEEEESEVDTPSSDSNE